jgi:hypothetical protein
MHIYAVLISILKYCFIVELFENCLSALPPPPVARFSWVTHLGVLATQRVEAPNPDATPGGGVGEGGGLGSPLAGFPPNTKN